MAGTTVNMNGFDALFKKTTPQSIVDTALAKFNADMKVLKLETVDEVWKFLREIQSVGFSSISEEDRIKFEDSEFEISLVLLGDLASASEYLDPECPAFKVKTGDGNVLYIPHDTLGYIEAYLNPTGLSAEYLRADNLPLMTEEDMREQLDVLFDLNVDNVDELRMSLIGLRVGGSTGEGFMLYAIQIFADKTLITVPLLFPAMLGEALNREPDVV